MYIALSHLWELSTYACLKFSIEKDALVPYKAQEVSVSCALLLIHNLCVSVLRVDLDLEVCIALIAIQLCGFLFAFFMVCRSLMTDQLSAALAP